jgi:hypothetical protein
MRLVDHDQAEIAIGQEQAERAPTTTLASPLAIARHARRRCDWRQVRMPGDRRDSRSAPAKRSRNWLGQRDLGQQHQRLAARRIACATASK